MPHSNRKKRNPVSAQKRLQVTDDDGWTHVTSGSNVRRVVRTTKVRNEREQVVQGDETELVLRPAEAPARLTFEELEAQYRDYKEKWVQSETWQTLKGNLDQRIHDKDSGASSQNLAVDGIVCIGLGSPSGFLRDGWVDRRAVSMYQLAALESIKDVLISLFAPFQKLSSMYHFELLPTYIFHPKVQTNLRPSRFALKIPSSTILIVHFSNHLVLLWLKVPLHLNASHLNRLYSVLVRSESIWICCFHQTRSLF